MAFEVPQNWAEQPTGMRDMYPHQAKYRREVESRLLVYFEEHGFDMVTSGTFEYVDTLLRGRDAQEADEWLRFVDPHGRMVALRPDMTPSIARMAAPLLHRGAREGGTRDVRWCYAEKVFRRTSGPASLSWASGKAAESTQVGVEWIGASGLETDAALLGLCQRAVAELDLEDWKMVISHAKFVPTVLELLGYEAADGRRFMNCLIRGDYVGFRELSRQLGLQEDLLDLLTAVNPLESTTLPKVIGDRMCQLEGLSEAAAQVKSLWDGLVQFAYVLQREELCQHVSFDFTLSRDISYYTGIVFEVFVPGIGAPIALGGRYDDLLSHFGTAAPAIGFTFEVERVLTAITEGQWLVDSGKGVRS